MITAIATLLWAIPFYAFVIGYAFGKDQHDPDTLQGWLHYRSH